MCVRVCQPAGLGFATSIPFVFVVGIFMSSWLGASVLTLGELFIKKMPLVSYIYSASKQISRAIRPGKSVCINIYSPNAYIYFYIHTY